MEANLPEMSPSRLRTCQIITSFNYKSAATVRCYRTAALLAGRGYEVLLITGREFLPHPHWDLSRFKVVQISSMVKPVSPANDLAALLRLYLTFKKWRPAVVHTHLAKAGILGRLAARLAGVPRLVHTVHGPSFPDNLPGLKRTFFRLLEKCCAPFTHRFVFVGDNLRQEYVDAGVCPPSRALVIRSCRPEKEYEAAFRVTSKKLALLRKSLVPDNECFIIGYVGRLVPCKNLDQAAGVAHLLRRRGINAHLVFIGETDPPGDKAYEDFLKHRVVELGLKDCVHFTGYREDVLTLMRAMDVLILTSSYEGLPNVAAEAGILGKLLVSYDVGGIKELFEDGQTAFIVPRGDIRALADRLSYVAAHPEAAQRMGEAAAPKIKALFQSPRWEEEKLQLYRSLLNS